MFRRNRADSHECRRDRDISFLGKRHEFLTGLGGNNAATAINHRSFTFRNQSGNLLNGRIINFQIWIVTAQTWLIRKHWRAIALLHVFRNINPDRAGPTGGRDMKCFLENPRQICRIHHQIAVLHHRQRHSENVGLLKRAATNHGAWHLTGNHHHRHRIHIRIGHAGDQIRRTGTAGGNRNTGLAASASVTAGRKSAALFMPGQNRANLFRACQRLMHFHARAAGIRKNHIHALAFEATDDDVCPAHSGVIGNSFLIFSFRFFAHTRGKLIPANWR